MDFDKILEHLGGIGRGRIFLCLLIFPCQIILAFSVYSQIFQQGGDDYRCLVKNCENETSEVYDPNWLHFTTPNEKDKKTDKMIVSRCHVYDYNSTLDTCNFDDFVTSTKLKCSKWIFSTEHKTLKKEWNLVCDEKWLLGLAMSIFMSGFLAGSFVFGIISDKFGRRTSVLICVVINVISSVSLIFSPNYYVYTIIRFFLGASSLGIGTVTFILLAEFCTPDQRFITLIPAFGWHVGEFFLIGFAYYVRDWRYLQTALAVPTCLYVLYFWFLPESPRWLISQRRYDDAEKVIKRFASWQRKSIPSKLLQVPPESEISKLENDVKLGPISLLRTREVRKRFLIVACIWFFDSLIGYGISLGARNMPGSLFVNFTFLSIGDVTGVLASTFIVHYVKRKKSMSISFLAVGILCLCNLAVNPGNTDQAIIITILCMLGRFTVSIAFTHTYIITSELFPTPVRSSALGTGSMCSRIGGMLASFIPQLADHWWPLPMVILGSAGLIAGILILTLPETFGKELPVTIDEVEMEGETRSTFIGKVFKRNGLKSFQTRSVSCQHILETSQ